MPKGVKKKKPCRRAQNANQKIKEALRMRDRSSLVNWRWTPVHTPLEASTGVWFPGIPPIHVREGQADFNAWCDRAHGNVEPSIDQQTYEFSVPPALAALRASATADVHDDLVSASRLAVESHIYRNVVGEADACTQECTAEFNRRLVAERLSVGRANHDSLQRLQRREQETTLSLSTSVKVYCHSLLEVEHELQRCDTDRRLQLQAATLKEAEASLAEQRAESRQHLLDIQNRSQAGFLQTSKELAVALQRELKEKNAAYVLMQTELKKQIDDLNAAHSKECNAHVTLREYNRVKACLQHSTTKVTQLEDDCHLLRDAAQQARSESDAVRMVLKVELMRSEFAYQRLQGHMENANSEIQALQRAVASHSAQRSQEELSQAVNTAVAAEQRRAQSEFDERLRATTRQFHAERQAALSRYWQERDNNTRLDRECELLKRDLNATKRELQDHLHALPALLSEMKIEGDKTQPTAEQVINAARIRNANDAYDVFRLQPTSAVVIASLKTQYHLLCLLVHPDKYNSPMATKTIQILNQAFETLNNADTRRACFEKRVRPQRWGP